MKRKRIILVALAAVLAVLVGIAVWRLLWSAPGLSAPIEMVEIQPGEFLMGSPEDEEGRRGDETQHLVRITYAFQMGKTEVTQRQWREVMGTTIRQQRDMEQRKDGDLPFFGERLKALGKAIKDDPSGAFEEIRDKGVWATFRWLAVGPNDCPIYGKGDDYPMHYINWDEATEFCGRLTEQERLAGKLAPGLEYRLPTEAEWEYACRAGSTTRYANGDTETDLDKIAWYKDNSGFTAHPVGTKLPNAWGLHDMHGNVSEWCHYWYDNYPAGDAVDPFGPATGSSRGMRGGCWHYSSSNCRSASRNGWYNPVFRDCNLGFRVVLAPVRPKE